MPTPYHHRMEWMSEKKLVGKHIETSFSDNQTPELWRSFMPLRDSIRNTIDNNLMDIQLYPNGFFDRFNPLTPFIKWAAKEVSSFNHIPHGMETLIIEAGQYAVFVYKGLPQMAGDFFEQIMGIWLPNSGYQLDNRPHICVLGAQYRNNHPDSEEEIWIPVAPK